MGCTSYHMIKISDANLTSAILNQNLCKCKEQLISSIYYLHKLNLTCNNEIESCIISRDKNLAVLIKMKQQIIKVKLQSLQKLVGKIDLCIDKEQIKVREMSDLEIQCQEQIKELSLEKVYSNKIRLLSESAIEQRSLQMSLEKYSICTKQIEIQIQHEIQMHEIASKNGLIVRRKFQKTRSSC